MEQSDRSVDILLGQVAAGMEVLSRIEEHLDGFITNSIPSMGRTTVSAIVVSDALVRYYTAVETLFLRISRFFENSLDSSRWHSDLLERMVLTIPNIRPPVIGHSTHSALRELMRFRHFSRYYVELEYDWDRLDFLLLKYHALKSSLMADLSVFENLLKKMSQGKGEL